eukprot:5686935-Amphidinium_carterae.1
MPDTDMQHAPQDPEWEPPCLQAWLDSDSASLTAPPPAPSHDQSLNPDQQQIALGAPHGIPTQLEEHQQVNNPQHWNDDADMDAPDTYARDFSRSYRMSLTKTRF